MNTWQSLSALQLAANWTLFGGLVSMGLLELIVPRPNLPRAGLRVRHAAHNLLLWLFGIAVISLLFGLSSWYLMIWMAWQRVGLLYWLSLPLWLHAVLAFLLLDFFDYVFHRLSHRVRWLWLMHAVHHSDASVDITTNLRQHPLHIVLTQAWQIVAATAIGAPLWVFLGREVVVIVVTHVQHAAVRWPLWVDSLLAWIMITPRAHWLHHSPEERGTNANFGPVLAVWDRLFATYVDPRTMDSGSFGLAALRAPGWHTAWGMLATPIWARSIERL